MLTKEQETYDRIIKVFDNNSIQYFLGGSRIDENDKDYDIFVYSDNYEKLLLILEHLGFKDNMKDTIHIIIILNEKSFMKGKLIHKKSGVQ